MRAHFLDMTLSYACRQNVTTGWCRYRLAFREFGTTLGVQVSLSADRALWLPRVQVGASAVLTLSAGTWTWLLDRGLTLQTLLLQAIHEYWEAGRCLWQVGALPACPFLPDFGRHSCNGCSQIRRHPAPAWHHFGHTGDVVSAPCLACDAAERQGHLGSDVLRQSYPGRVGPPVAGAPLIRGPPAVDYPHVHMHGCYVCLVKPETETLGMFWKITPCQNNQESERSILFKRI